MNHFPRHNVCRAILFEGKGWTGGERSKWWPWAAQDQVLNSTVGKTFFLQLTHFYFWKEMEPITSITFPLQQPLPTSLQLLWKESVDFSNWFSNCDLQNLEHSAKMRNWVFTKRFEKSSNWRSQGKGQREREEGNYVVQWCWPFLAPIRFALFCFARIVHWSSESWESFWWVQTLTSLNSMFIEAINVWHEIQAQMFWSWQSWMEMGMIAFTVEDFNWKKQRFLPAQITE